MPAKAKSKAKTKAKTKQKAASTTAKAGAKAKTKAAPKAKAKVASKATTKGKVKAAAKAVPKAKTAPKAKAAPKAKTAPKAKAAPKTKARASGKSAKKSSTNFTDFEPYQAKRNEDYMNETQRAHFSDILLAWKAELMVEVDRTVSHMKDEAANFPDPADRATQEEEFSLELRTRDRERKLIKKIESTLELIDQDDYGYCYSCGVEIGVKRLEARPTASLCIDCKTLDEIREKQQHG